MLDGANLSSRFAHLRSVGCKGEGPRGNFPTHWNICVTMNWTLSVGCAGFKSTHVLYL